MAQLPTLPTSSTNKKKTKPRSYLVFFSFRLIKLPIYHFLYHNLIPRCISYTIGDFRPTDFKPSPSHLFPNIYTLTQRQIALRTYIAVFWIYEGFLILDTANCVLGPFFVATGLDGHNDWPVLFRNLAAAKSLRRFWGKF